MRFDTVIALIADAEAWARTSTYRQGKAEPTSVLRTTMRTKAAFEAFTRELDRALGMRTVQPQVALMLLAFAARRPREFLAEWSSRR
ncbi:MAG: hypothetical protein ACYDCK_08970 [Thermoplasmatota archaeon]